MALATGGIVLLQGLDKLTGWVLNSRMAENDPTGTNWSDREVDLIVADYFDMLRLELAGEHYVKSQRNAALQELTGRSKGSIEFKHQNISAVLHELGMPRIIGYKPMANYQKALIDGIERFLDLRGEISVSVGTSSHESVHVGLSEAEPIFIGAAPQQASVSPAENQILNRLVRKFDPAARDARNRALGKRGEERVFLSERARLIAEDRADLARKIRWVSEEDGDGAGYDILSFNRTGGERLLEVKTTTGHELTPFYLSENERQVSVERSDVFNLVRLYDFARTPKAFELRPPLEESVMLRPINYRASFT